MKPLDQYKLAAVVGISAACMLFGQGGACIGKRFHLAATGRGYNRKPVVVTMTPDGAVLTKPTGAPFEVKATKQQIEDEENDNE